MDTNYYRYRSTGIVDWYPGQGTRYYDQWCAIVRCDQSIVDYYCWVMLKYGIPIQRNRLFGAHITFVRNDVMIIKGKFATFSRNDFEINRSKWAKHTDPVEFYYSSNIQWADDKSHAWLPVWSEALMQLRLDLGLNKEYKYGFHISLGRLICL